MLGFIEHSAPNVPCGHCRYAGDLRVYALPGLQLRQTYLPRHERRRNGQVQRVFEGAELDLRSVQVRNRLRMQQNDLVGETLGPLGKNPSALQLAFPEALDIGLARELDLEALALRIVRILV